jgi:C-terminal processing protease CtpA/Prc
MKTGWVVNAALGLLLLAAPIVAQTDADKEKQRREAEAQMRQAEQQMRQAELQVREAARQLARLSADHDKIRNIERRVVVFDDHARLGVVLRSGADPKTDALGAYVEALSPGGPAEEAGLRAGDIITTFDGKPLGGAASGTDEEECGPCSKLTELASALKDGDKVVLGYRRGKATGTVTVIARRLLGPRVKVMGIPGAHDIEIPDIEMPDIDVDVFMAGRPWRDIDLVAMNPDLGRYFGTSDGLLVVRAPKDSPLKLTGGDVILKIGDRAPATPTQAMRILRSYDPGDTVTLQVIRKHEKLTLSAQVPARRAESGRWRESVPAAPAPPAAPAAPAPPAPPASPSPPAQTLD